MSESGFSKSELPLELIQTLQVQDAAKVNNPTAPEYVWEASRKAAHTLCRWELPSSAVEAALLIPLLECGYITSESPMMFEGQKSLELAKQLMTLPLPFEYPDSQPEPSTSQDYMKLRRLFRWAYLKLDAALLAMAFHDALLTYSDLPESRGRYLTHETDHVFVPVAEMLGMWSIRRKWLDRSAKIASRFEQKDELYRRTLSELENSKEERSEAFNKVRETLCARAEERSINIEPRLRPPRVGSIIYRHAEGESIDELTTRLTVEVFCESEKDCYHALGLVHSLGKPVAPRFSERFDDYIASPQPNGYQALHTAIIYHYESGSAGRERQILVEFRILTESMHQLNQRGVVEALYLRRDHHRHAAAWWNDTARLSAELRERYKLGYTIQEYLLQYGLDSRPHPAELETCLQRSCPLLYNEKPPAHPVYVFTPRGEIYLLPDGATALDFAYFIHSEIGHQVQKIWMNDRSVPLSYPLHNGDIVRIDVDPHSDGPDFSWLRDVTTDLARSKVRSGLSQQADRTHPGRHEIESILLSVMQYYEREKDYAMRVTTKRLDDFLLRMAKGRGLPDIEALYDKVVEGSISPDKIVHRFMSEELAAAILDRHGRPVFASYPPYRISLCGMCRPVPNDAIVGRERRFGAATIGLAVHRVDNAKCTGIPRADEAITLRWAEVSASDDHFMELEIAANDRYHILGDILDIVYEQTGVQLYEVNAHTTDDGRANINIVISGAWDRLAQIHTHIELTDYVHSVHMRALSLPRKLALTTPHVPSRDRIPNPYTLQEVYGRSMFYNRETQIKRILEWLEGPPPTRLLVLHGQRRVGKTSLAKHLIEERLDSRRVRPVFIDFQELSLFTAQEITDLIVREVYESLAEPIPDQTPSESPASFLNRALEYAIRKPKGYRLLLIIDEFNVLMQKEEKQELDPVVFPHLRAVLNRRRDVHFLLIVQDTYFRSPPQHGGAGDVLQQADDLPLPPLDANYARKLIIEPLQRSGCSVDEGIVHDILALTSGVPYYIHILCSELIEHINRQKRTQIGHRELEQVLPSILRHGDRYFHHFTERLHGLNRVVLTATATHQQTSNQVSLATVAADLESQGFSRRFSALRRAAIELSHQGMLNIEENTDGSTSVYIPIGLFQRWIAQNFDPKRIVEEVKTVHQYTGKSGQSSTPKIPQEGTGQDDQE